MQEKLREEMKEAMRAKDSVKLNVIRGLLSAFTNELVAKGRTPQDKLTSEEELAVIKRAVKQRKDSIEQFTKGGRTDLVENEAAELKLLEVYLPAQMGRDEIEKIAKELKEKLGATDKSKMGIFMGALMKELKGAADGALVKEVVETLF
jgi:uncharacterized protein YqeY